ncbi:glutamate ABC transporter substrate-binding protein [Sphaerisporangium melleum]|uniref:Glutamate ABC transporter substrate-binding protein n=1 Tax=Sphaerisporangium melleum TaxID=321316 RepID=A0A917R2A1_9ACTN|nr:glutamate ABC transporter substrate-binding protein [Sphaerisporangium melleum]GGK82850.1 glutamate ABC transporter substrate-binding protein [Sphaerisporangium melleum]GII69213.1 glutamate ABC transporter substrate-binding protein [Sphaerisporangium melleum]
MRLRRFGALLLSAAALSSLAACGGGSDSYASVVEKAEKTKKLTIGVKFDQPALGLKKPDGSVEGFDVDVAKYVAKQLGVDESNISWKETISKNREPFIQQGQVDLVVATYSILPERKEKVGFGGPYILAHQDTMVRGNETSISKVEDLKGKRICQASGSNSYKRITDPPPNGRSIEAQLVPAGSYGECVERLKGGTLDAVTTDNLILAGFASQGGDFKILGVPFTDEKYGIGMKKGDTSTCNKVNEAITKMYQDGTATQLLQKWFGAAKGLEFPTTPPQFEPCS